MLFYFLSVSLQNGHVKITVKYSEVLHSDPYSCAGVVMKKEIQLNSLFQRAVLFSCFLQRLQQMLKL